MREYYISVAKYLDTNFEPLSKDKESKLDECLSIDIVEYYNTNILPEVAAEYIAQKLNIKRLNESLN